MNQSCRANYLVYLRTTVFSDFQFRQPAVTQQLELQVLIGLYLQVASQEPDISTFKV